MKFFRTLPWPSLSSVFTRDSLLTTRLVICTFAKFLCIFTSFFPADLSSFTVRLMALSIYSSGVFSFAFSERVSFRSCSTRWAGPVPWDKDICTGSGDSVLLPIRRFFKETPLFDPVDWLSSTSSSATLFAEIAAIAVISALWLSSARLATLTRGGRRLSSSMSSSSSDSVHPADLRLAFDGSEGSTCGMLGLNILFQ